MRSCWDVPVTDYFTTGAVAFFYNEVDFIGNVSFEGNYAKSYGGKTLLQQYAECEPNPRQ